MKEKTKFIYAVSVTITFLLMVIVNGLANALPINGIGTGQVSDSYPNLFAPIGLTFAIWGVIYLLLLIHVVHQFIKRNEYYEDSKHRRIALLFSFSSLINTIWIFAWHYQAIGMSLILMLLILISLILINIQLIKAKSKKDTLLIKVPFSVYFGWITVATIANVTTFLVSVGWDGFGISEILWTNIIILVGTAIAYISIQFYRSYAYGFVVVWAYIGIILKHMSKDFFDWTYPTVIIVTMFSLAILLLSEIMLFRKIRIETRNQS